MVRKLCFSLLLSLFTAMIMAQELQVEHFQPTTQVLRDSNRRTDTNGDYCAVVEVLLPVEGVNFDGYIVGAPLFNINKYWVYMTEGSRQLQINMKGYNALDVVFNDYGIKSLKQNIIYSLKIKIPSVATNEPADAGGNFIALTVKPIEAKVKIDGKDLRVEPSGQYTQMLSYGQHNYEVSCGGFLPRSGTFTISKGNATELNVSLESALATLTVNCPTAGATIYVDKKSMGTSPWTGSLQDGMHLIEAKLAGHRDVQKSITLAEQQKLTVSLDALTPIQGNLSVDYRPIGSDIYIDGAKSGTSPSVFNGILVGSHRVEIKKDGYTSETKTVSISEGQTSSLQGSLNAIAQTSTISTPTPSQVVSSGSDLLTFTANGVSFSMVKVQGGTFTMGATSEQNNPYGEEKPTHEVTLSSYYIGQTEVTQGLWEAVMDNNPSTFKGFDLPVEQVSWDDCQEFIKKLNMLTGKTFRLPTEAEWEFAARGGDKSKHTQYSGSSEIGDVAWYEGNSGRKTHPVATKQSNELGIYDMSGNVSEWCSDRFGNYKVSPQTNPTGPNGGIRRVFRGGSWGRNAGGCRSSYRTDYSPVNRCSLLGLRLCLSE